MYKVIHPFNTWIDRCYVPVFIKIEIKETDQGKRLSISGVEGPSKNDDAKGGCGQINMAMTDSYLSSIDLADGWTIDMVHQLLSIWKEWHLNDMHPDCIHQRKLGWSDRRIDPDLPKNFRSVFGDFLEINEPIRNTWVNVWYKEPVLPQPHHTLSRCHENGLLMAPCPVCGYRYGSAWFYEPIPQDVLDALSHFPETTKEYAWV